MKALFEIHGLKVCFAQRCVLDIPQLSLPQGKLTAIVGANGAGKSTLLKALLGQYPSQVWQCLGENGRDKLQQGKIAWVGQHETFATPLSVLEYVLLGKSMHLGWFGRCSEQDVLLARQLLGEFELEHLANQRLQKLSGGEQQRAAIVRALMQQAPVMLLDEPSNHLDIRHQHLLMQQLQKYCQSQYFSAVIVLHDLALAANYCDEVVLMQNGKVVQQGRPETVFQREHLQDAYQWHIEPVLQDGVWSFQSMPQR